MQNRTRKLPEKGKSQGFTSKEIKRRGFLKASNDVPMAVYAQDYPL